MEHKLLPSQPNERIIGDKYLYHNKIVMWDGKRLRCQHNRRRERCKECGGSQVCIHNKNRYTCLDCGKKQICKHKKRKIYCVLCDGSHICQHNRRRYECRFCYPNYYCEHKIKRLFCQVCTGISRCPHKRVKNCKICKEESIKWNNIFLNFTIDDNYKIPE